VGGDKELTQVKVAKGHMSKSAVVTPHVPIHHRIHEVVKSTFFTFWGWCFHIIFAIIVFALVWYCNNIYDFVGAIRLQVARIRQD